MAEQKERERREEEKRERGRKWEEKQGSRGEKTRGKKKYKQWSSTCSSLLQQIYQWAHNEYINDDKIVKSLKTTQSNWSELLNWAQSVVKHDVLHCSYWFVVSLQQKKQEKRLKMVLLFGHIKKRGFKRVCS